MRSPECFPGIRWHPDSGPGVQDDNLVKKIGDAIADDPPIHLPACCVNTLIPELP